MPAKVTLTIIAGKLKGQEYQFSDRTTCIIGRATDCHLQLPDDRDHRNISRYHCFLDINPPDIRIRDFGSLNGTYVNNQKIGQRQPHQTPEEGAKLDLPEYDLQNNDTIIVGDAVFEVGIERDSFESFERLHANLKPENPNFIGILKKLIQRALSGESSLISIRGYQIIRKLGAGGCGEVYLALNQDTNDWVAIKVMLPQVAASESGVKRFLREMANTKALNHPNVVRLRDYGYCDDSFFFTLDYCEGGNVVDLMAKRGGTLSVEEAIAIILQVLDGLDYAHYAEIPYVRQADGTIAQGRGLVHRDIKPHNIFLTRINSDTIAKVGDYGLAKAFDQAGLSGQTFSGRDFAGTLEFLPRQQVIDYKYVTPEVDVWATAASLYCMLTGCCPRNFDDKEPFLVVLQTDAIPIRQRNSAIPVGLAEVIDFALVDKPDIYFKSAREFKEALVSVQ
ncbi:protein kinase domain-containing protein [Limnofasciculus baicalensis]|uniref:Serine/threonine-protein kinase n=1 Tax=Limnofasciculus baicalensis BBK-W-15 TaxID=2699891 RepID=A0AAE3GRE6_9CYAN|nr:protein kinase [Limnofasciculus baicalensis]MCP2728556.1 serine/threonine-protein kinase [Limnofasciculus baicalensis BBK-W-15]